MSKSILEILREVNKLFLPQRFPEKGMPSLVVADHVNDFLGAFAASSDDVTADPISIVAPNFYMVDDWSQSPVRRKGRAGPVTWWGRVAKLNERLNAQVKWSDVRDPNDPRGVTSRVMDAVNASQQLGRTIMVIHPTGVDHDSLESHLVDEHFLRFQISDATIKSYANHAQVPCALKIDASFMQASISDISTAQDKAPVGIIPTVPVVKSSGVVGVELTALGCSLAPYVDDHALYIDSEHSLVYVFSNIVQVGSIQKGCGGLFMVVRNDALTSIRYWLIDAKRLADKVANRIVHQMQLEDVERQALNSAITQTAARNYAHHIGAHVKMRTTPQEIKKRIKELHSGQFNGI